MMERPDRPQPGHAPELSGTEARGGSTPHVTRSVLGILLLLAVVAMMLILYPAS